MRKLLAAGLMIAITSLAACNSDAPMYGHADNYDRTHLQFGSSDLESSTRVNPVTATRDPAGLLHVSVNIRNITDKQLYVDCFITFLRDGQVLEKLGPKTVTLKNGLPDTITMNSTQPATDYFISLDYAK